MDPQVVLDLYGQGFYLIVVIVSAVMVPSLVVSIFQAATQINEQTLSFLPRLIVTIFAIMHLGPWLLTTLTDFFNQLFIDIPMLIS
ncbi:flagellar biosynthetic protein FliQ [Marinomonas ostreistagni]|uniref:flagellar biosynthetic protein FliQ n=1 Tax=Marinomonas ostreistagni TaxID=359209 RepID=UPI00194E1CDC|nr:flagellar biosynthetic protein FliQ [Marinomonas ostreistagni]MBM6551257.1 flagellar biosynthetic protein FliQ [Marinomonas ostreistagni]